MGSIAAFKKQPKEPTLAEHVEGFLHDLQGANRSPNTIRGYRSDLAGFLAHYKGSLGALTQDVLRKYLAEHVDHQAPATRARKRAAITSFLGWCSRRDLISTNPMTKLERVKLPEAQPNFRPEDEIDRVLGAIRNDRDRVLFTLAAETGIRIAEALTLRVEDVRLESEEVTVFGKGQKARTVYLTKTRSLRLLRAYLKRMGFKSGLVFRPDERKQRAGVSGKPLDYSVINRAWKRYCTEAGIDGCNIHALRHTYATRLVNKAVPIEMVSKVLGHASVQTTQRYARVSDKAIKERLSQVL